MYIYIYTYIHIYIYTYTYIHIYIYTYIHIYIYTYIYIYTQTYSCVCIIVRMYVCLDGCMDMFERKIHVCMHINMYIEIVCCALIHVFVYVLPYK